MEKVNLAALTGRYVGLKWSQMTCIGLMDAVYRELGADVPTVYDGLTVETALDAWKEDPNGTIKKMIAFFKTLGESSYAHRPRKFDLLVVVRKGEVFPAIALDRGRFMTSTLHEGVVVARLGKLCRAVLARRIL